eukprot:279936_1
MANPKKFSDTGDANDAKFKACLDKRLREGLTIDQGLELLYLTPDGHMRALMTSMAIYDSMLLQGDNPDPSFMKDLQDLLSPKPIQQSTAHQTRASKSQHTQLSKEEDEKKNKDEDEDSLEELEYEREKEKENQEEEENQEMNANLKQKDYRNDATQKKGKDAQELDVHDDDKVELDVISGGYLNEESDHEENQIIENGSNDDCNMNANNGTNYNDNSTY